MHRGSGEPAPWTTLGAVRRGGLFEDEAGVVCRKVATLPSGTVIVAAVEGGGEVTLPADFAARPVVEARPKAGGEAR